VSDLKTLCGFLQQTQNPYRVFDMGRRVSKISNSDFARFEAGEQPYPAPLQHQAWFGVLNWNNKNPDEHFIFFLKLPLDEAAGLVYAARDDFVYRLLQSLKSSVQGNSDGQQIEDAMKNSPYGFTPNQERMAVFHAKALKTMGATASKYYDHSREYFSGKLGYDQWAFVGMQGIADLAVRWDEDDNSRLIAAAIPRLPGQPLEALCKCLENEPVGSEIAESLAARLTGLLDDAQADPLEISALLRGLSFAQAGGLRRSVIKKLLATSHGNNLDILVTLSGRCWTDLADAELCHHFLEALVVTPQGSEIFSGLMADLLFIPGMRQPLMDQLRSPQRSEALGQAIGRLFGAVGS